MRAAFETTVLDLPRPMLVAHPHLVHDAHVCIVVVEFTLAATRDAIRILSWLKANAPQARVLVVANKVQGNGLEINRGEFEKSIERKVDLVIPYDLKAATQAAKLGQPLAKAATGAKVAQPFAQLVTLTTSAVDGTSEAAAAAPTSLLSKLNLKDMLAKKPKAA
jgi:pilus assembly protein CpaE